MTHDFILIHGTFARGLFRPSELRLATWCQDGQPIRRMILETFGASARVHPFNWSGANAPQGRLTAARQLAALTERIRAERPHSHIHLIAHSHAGNVALYATRDAAFRSRLSSLVCLSTPFLHIYPRDLGPKLAKRLEIAAGFSVAFLVVVACWLLWPTAVAEAYRLAREGTWLTYALGVIPTGLILGLIAVGSMRLFSDVHRINHEFAKRLELPKSLPFPVLLVRAPGDEALGLLGAMQFVSGAVTRLLRPIMGLVSVDEVIDLQAMGVRAKWRSLALPIRLGAMLVACAAALVGALLFMKMLDVKPSPSAIEATVLVLLALMLAGAVMIAYATVMLFLAIPFLVVLSLLLAFLATPFGFRFALAALGLHISAEATPPGEWMVTQIDCGTASLEENQALSHDTHNNAAAVKAIAKFYRNRFRAP
jgi:hypothetical protein